MKKSNPAAAGTGAMAIQPYVGNVAAPCLSRVASLTNMWHHVFENTLPALAGAGVVGLILGLTKQRSAVWILLMVLMFVLIAASTQIVWELFPQLHHGWERFAVVIGVAAVIGILFAPLMRRFCKKENHDA